MTNKSKTLTQAFEGRNAEIADYQINIDNYRLALLEIENNYSDHEDLTVFKTQVEGLLSSSILEQKKSIIMRDVIKYQLEDQK